MHVGIAAWFTFCRVAGVFPTCMPTSRPTTSFRRSILGMLARCCAAFAYTLEKRRSAGSIGDPSWMRYARKPKRSGAVRQRYRDAKRLFVYAGTIGEVQRGTVTIALRDGERADVRPDWIVNCTGVGGASAMRRDPLLAGMFADDLISAVPGNLGLRTTSDLVAVGSTNAPTEGLWIVGPPVRGSRFEATAVPELRVMAELVAREIARAARPAFESLQASRQS
jgi:hypothetical protein